VDQWLDEAVAHRLSRSLKQLKDAHESVGKLLESVNE